MTERSTHHATFSIERTFEASPARVFNAWADPAAKAGWFVGPDEWNQGRHELDFRIGGRERLSGGAADGPVYTEQGAFLDGLDTPEQREEGTRGLLDNLDAALRREPARA